MGDNAGCEGGHRLGRKRMRLDRQGGGGLLLLSAFLPEVDHRDIGHVLPDIGRLHVGPVNLNNDKVVPLPGISIIWGLALMVLVYSVCHISGAHFNPAVTIAFGTCKWFPWKQVPAYVAVQVLGSTLASRAIPLLFTGDQNHFVGTSPAGSNMQAFIIEFIITFYHMYVVSGVATDNSAIGELAGLAVGATVLLNVLFPGAITGASMNPARSLGPTFIWSHYKGIWIYLVAPTLGAITGAWIYNTIRFTDKPLREITRSGSFLKSTRISRT